MLCKCKVCFGVQITIKQIFKVLEIYGWLLDSYVVDFYVLNLWQKLPKSWQRFLITVNPQELGEWISNKSNSKHVWPLSFIALRKVISTLEICRDHNKDVMYKCMSKAEHEKTRAEIALKNERLGEITNSTTNDNSRFNNLFIKHIKKKKRYEIDQIAKILVECAKKTNCQCIVDIGAGMGHLSRVLAYKHNLCMVCIEQDEVLSKEAMQLDEEFEITIKKHLPDFSNSSPRHVSLRVDVSNDCRKELANRLTRIFSENFPLDNRKSGFGLLGLHPCGDLACTLLRLYTTESNAKFISIVGCCYMKLTLREEEGLEIGYPMSKYVAGIEGHELSYTALEVACHAIEKHTDKLKSGKYSDLIVHSYRTTLEYLLVAKNPELRHAKIKSTKAKENMTFEEYCKAATENFEPQNQLSDSDFQKPEVSIFLNEWTKVLTFGTLRLMLAPLIETLVLFDRFLFLSEQDLSPTLKAEFDPRVSPRNFLLISTKDN